MGDMVLSVPSVLVTLLAGLAFGAHFEIASPLAALAALTCVFLGALAVGTAFSGLFILSRNANPLANFLQTPIYILGGFYVPRSVLPGWLEPLALVLPVTHALDALRATTIAGAGWTEVGDSLALAVLTSAIFLALGAWSLGRVDHALRRSGALNLF
jgi:ABC-2 type transport system permease protein